MIYGKVLWDFVPEDSFEFALAFSLVSAEGKSSVDISLGVLASSRVKVPSQITSKQRASGSSEMTLPLAKFWISFFFSAANFSVTLVL